MPPTLHLSSAVLLAWLSHLEYPPPSAQASVLVYAEGSVAQLTSAQGGHLWPGEGQGLVGDLWEQTGPQDALALSVVPDVVDAQDDAGLFLWAGPAGEAHFAAFQGSCNAGSRLSGTRGWPQLGDGWHPYAQSRRNDSGKPCFRSANNRVLREVPVSATQGGDGVLTLSEVVARGMGINASILGHPGKRGTWSAGCWLAGFDYNSPPWLALWGHTTDRPLIVILAPAEDLAAFAAAFRAGLAHRHIPILRPGCNARRWVAPLQIALGVRPDGVYGPQTAAALLAARRRAGLPEAIAQDVRITAADWQALGAVPPFCA